MLILTHFICPVDVRKIAAEHGACSVYQQAQALAHMFKNIFLFFPKKPDTVKGSNDEKS